MILLKMHRNSLKSSMIAQPSKKRSPVCKMHQRGFSYMLQHNSNQAWCQRIKMYRSWPSICASMRPFICSTSIFTMARPKPVFWPVRIRSAVKNRSKIRLASSGDSPWAVSYTHLDLREFLCILSKIKDQSPYLQKMLSESQNMLFTFDGLLATLKKKRLLF